MLAVEFGKKYESCIAALEWRRSLPEGATQADAYLLCERADWLVWQLTREPDVWLRVHDAVIPLVTAMADRAVERHCLRCGVPAVEQWAARWLDGTDRSQAAAWAEAAAAAWAAWAEAAAEAAARAEEAWARAADNLPEWHAEWCEKIRAAVPEWPGVTEEG